MIAVLLKTTLRRTLGRLSGKHAKRLVLTLLAAAVLPTLIVLQTYSLFNLWLQFSNLGAAFVMHLLTYFLQGVFVLLLVTGFTSALHYFYLSEDLPLLASLPLPTSAVFALKFAETAWACFVTFFFFGLPLLISAVAALRIGSAGLLLVPAAFFFVLSAAGLAAAAATLAAKIINASALRRFTRMILGLLVIGAWAALQLMRPERLDPSSELFEPNALEELSRHAAGGGWSPAAQLIGTLETALRGDISAALRSLLLPVAGAVAFGWAAVAMRARSEAAQGLKNGAAAGHRIPYRLRSFQQPLLSKETKLIFRDLRTVQTLLLFTVVMVVWPFLHSRSGTVDAGAFPDLESFLPQAFFLTAAAMVLARQSLPMERRAFMYSLTAPMPLRMQLIVKAALPVLLMGGAAAVGAAVAAWRFHYSWVTLIELWAVSFMVTAVGAAVGFYVGARFGRFDWQDPRQMLSPGSFYSSLLIGQTLAGGGFGLFMVLKAIGGALLAFLCFFLYVAVLFTAAVHFSEKRLIHFDWV